MQNTKWAVIRVTARAPFARCCLCVHRNVVSLKCMKLFLFAGCSAIPQPPPSILAWCSLPARYSQADINHGFRFFIDLQYKTISGLILLRHSLKLEEGRISSVWFLLFKSVQGECLQLVVATTYFWRKTTDFFCSKQYVTLVRIWTESQYRDILPLVELLSGHISPWS